MLIASCLRISNKARKFNQMFLNWESKLSTLSNRFMSFSSLVARNMTLWKCLASWALSSQIKGKSAKTGIKWRVFRAIIHSTTPSMPLIKLVFKAASLCSKSIRTSFPTRPWKWKTRSKISIKRSRPHMELQTSKSTLIICTQFAFMMEMQKVVIIIPLFTTDSRKNGEDSMISE